MPFDLDASDASFRAARKPDAREQLRRVMAELDDAELRELLTLAERIELRRELSRERRRP